MAEVTEKIISVKTQVDGANNIKELKSQIAELTAQLRNGDSASDEYKNTVNELVSKQTELNTVMREGKSQLSSMDGSYNALVNQMGALKTVWKSVNDEATRNELGVQIDDINNRLKELDASTGNFQRNVGNYSSAISALTANYKNQKQELAALKTAMDNLEPSSDAYAEAFQRASEITHNLTERQEELKYASRDFGDQLSNVRGIASNLAAGFGAVNAAMGLFGSESEDVQKAMLKVQQSIALVQGLEGLDGFIKRTEGLSKALGLTKKATDALTISTTADATATAADTTAKGAQTIATEATTVAQKGLNAAMKANPIGAVIAIITAAIAVFALLKDEIIELFGGTEKLNGVFNKLKVVGSGVANVIKNFLIAPVKIAITYFTTLGKVMKDVFTLNWDAIADDFKEGVTKIAEEVKEGIDVVGNYQEGAQEKAVDLAKEETKKKAAEYVKDKENYIKDVEAKKGADWKYTEEGKEKYEEYYKKKLEMYDKDSEEYRQVQRDMWAYDRDYQNRITKNEKEESDKRTKNAEKEAEKKKKLLEEYTKEVVDFMKTSSQKEKENISKRIEAWNNQHKEQQIVFSYKFPEINKEDFEKRIYEALDKIELSDYLNKITREQISKANFVKALQTQFDAKNFFVGVIKPEEQIALYKNMYDEQIKAYNEYSKTLVAKQKEILDTYGEDSELYKQITAEAYDVAFKGAELAIEKYKAISNAAKESYTAQIEGLRELSSYQLASQQATYEKERAKKGNNWFEPAKLKAELDAEYQIIVEGLTKQKEIYDKMAKDENLSFDEKQNALLMSARLEQELALQTADYEIAQYNRRREAANAYIETTKSVADGIGSILQNVANAWETSIQAQVDAGEISEEEGERQMEEMRGLQSAIALINAFSSAVGAYQSMASIPYVGPALGAAAAAAALAAGIAQVVAINKVKKGDKGTSTSSTYNVATPTMPDYSPNAVTNITGGQETENLANAITNKPIRAYVVESDMTEAQKKAATRNQESSF